MPVSTKKSTRRTMPLSTRTLPGLTRPPRPEAEVTEYTPAPSRTRYRPASPDLTRFTIVPPCENVKVTPGDGLLQGVSWRQTGLGVVTTPRRPEDTVDAAGEAEARAARTAASAALRMSRMLASPPPSGPANTIFNT